MNPLTKEAFADWAGNQPADGKYDFWNTRGCAVFQYARACGFDAVEAGARDFEISGGGLHEIDGVTSEVGDRPHTFGALAERLRK